MSDTLTKEFQVCRYYALLTQEFGHSQNDIGSRNTSWTSPGEFDAYDVWQTHHRGTAQHHIFGFQTTHTNGDNTQGINMGRMRISPNTGIREGHSIMDLDYRGHLLQINLVHDAIPRRDHVDVEKGVLAPIDKMKTFFVATFFNGAVFVNSLWIKSAMFHCKGMVHNQLRRHHRVDPSRIPTSIGDSIT